MAKVREKEEAAAILEERRAWERAEARVNAEREKAERDAARAEKKQEEDRRRAEKASAFAEERERKKQRARRALSAAETTTTFPENPSFDGLTFSPISPTGGSIANPARVEWAFDDESGGSSVESHAYAHTVALVPGHWIDPGEETGSPGERELNARIADKAHENLRRMGWTVLRPDTFAPALAWDAYLDWARAQCVSGVPLLEIHGQGSGAEMHGRVTGVISQTGSVAGNAGPRVSVSPLGDALEARFGRFPMDWRELVVSRVGGAVVESFETEVLEAMPPKAREAAMDAIARDIAEAVDSTRFGEPPEAGCSTSGCPRA